MKEMKTNKPVFLGIFLLSLSALMLEISLTRIFSIAKWHHFAFMVISIALLGYGAAGSFLTMLPKAKEKNIYKLFCLLAFLFSFSTILAFLATNAIPIDPFRILYDKIQWMNVLIHYLLLAVPFFSAGFVIALAFKKLPKAIGKLYAADLIGAGCGSLLAVLLAFFLEPVTLIFLISLTALLASFIFSLKYSRKATLLVIISSLILISIYFVFPIQINSSPYKQLNLAMQFPQAEILFTGFNPISKIDVVKSPAIKIAPGLSPKFKEKFPEQLGLLVDNDGLNPITKYDEVTQEFINSLPASLAYKLRNKPKTLILGLNNLNLLIALKNDSSSIILVEANPLLLNALQHFNEFNGNLLERKEIEIETINARTFIKKTAKQFDIIQLSLTEGIIPSSTGLYGMNENYFLTVEAFSDYYSHLSANGILSITRWLNFPPKDSLKIVSLGKEALKNNSVKKPQENILVIRTLTTSTFLMKKIPFNAEEIRTIKEFCKENNFDTIYSPGIREEETNQFNKFQEPYYYQFTTQILSQEAQESKQFHEKYLFNVEAASDDKPFFANFFKWSKIPELYESMHKKWEPFFEGGFLIYTIFLQALMLSLLLIFLPVLIFKRIKNKFKSKYKQAKRMLTYFLLLGIGFMFIEIVLIQHFILFLGEAIYSISIVLFSLLVFSGTGAFYSSRISLKKRMPLQKIILLLALLVFIYLLTLPNIFNALLAYPLAIRIVSSMLLLLPLGFLIGMPFPVGIRLAHKIDSRVVALGYAVNGCASVLAAILAVIIAISLGYSAVLALAVICYLIAMVILSQQ